MKIYRYIPLSLFFGSYALNVDIDKSTLQELIRKYVEESVHSITLAGELTIKNIQFNFEKKLKASYQSIHQLLGCSDIEYENVIKKNIESAKDQDEVWCNFKNYINTLMTSNFDPDVQKACSQELEKIKHACFDAHSRIRGINQFFTEDVKQYYEVCIKNVLPSNAIQPFVKCVNHKEKLIKYAIERWQKTPFKSRSFDEKFKEWNSLNNRDLIS